ncbi:hypothetical protein [Saccharopolyspora phatthalungensis]|uniref:Uncharacterized protein n=1 Tax=Saccharopolyspora phatthalungensis TaxID=664693 RepID=A0A840Q0X3_9PSEU|nr:hypothetical protein [Saccharopolyspora phatthalungensis]MBB5153620.1 hypothetical protein [Saccharopolyspora phatthalungensis]
MSALEDVLQALRTAVGKIDEARDGLSTAKDRWEERGEMLAGCLYGTNDPDAQEVLASQGVTSEAMYVVREQLGAVQRRIEQYQKQLGSAEAPTPTGAGGMPPAESKPISNFHGDAYPPEAAGLIEQLPKRVTPNNNERTVGVARLGDKLFPPDAFRARSRVVGEGA